VSNLVVVSGPSGHARRQHRRRDPRRATGFGDDAYPSIHAKGGGDQRGRLERLVTRDAVTEITRLKSEDGGPMDVGGATLAATAMPAGLIDEYAIVTHPVLLGGGTPFFTALDTWVNLNLIQTRTFPNGVLLTRYETRR
jgi:dihydrofolate reductase